MIDLTSESDFHFDYDELVDNFDEFQLSDEDVEQRNPINKNDDICSPISLEELLSLLIAFPTEEIFNLITDQTNIYGKRNEQSSNQRKISQWNDVNNQ